MRSAIVIFIAVMAFVVTGNCFAQRNGSAFSGSTTSSGLFGSRSLGQGISGGGGTFSGTPGNLVEQAQSGAGEVQGGERFTRDGRDAASFVGADSADTSNFFGQTQGFGNSGLEQFLNLAARRDFQNQGGTAGGSVTPLRPALSLGFAPPTTTPTVFNVRVNQRLAKLPNLEILEPVSIDLTNRTAIIRGRVATEHDRTLIAQLLMLEPGVSSVSNELAVGDSTTQLPAAPKSTDAAGDNALPTATPIPPPIPEELPWLPDAQEADAPPAAPTAPSADG